MYSSPYHPQTNGLCERFNDMLKQLLHPFSTSHKDWERYLPHLLFAYREVPQESTGYCPFKLLYGRRVRGPLDLLRKHWNEELSTGEATVVAYALTRVDLLHLTQFGGCSQLSENWYNRSVWDQTFQLYQKVLVFQPLKQDNLQAVWYGPCKMMEKLCDTTYIVPDCSNESLW